MGDAGHQQHQRSSPAQGFQMFTPSTYNPATSGYAGSAASNEGSSNSNTGFNNKPSNGSLVANGLSHPQDSAGDQSSQYGQPDGNAGTSTAGGSDQQPTKFSRSKGVRVMLLSREACSPALIHRYSAPLPTRSLPTPPFVHYQACQQCRAVKQRCSGASKHPCERCQL